MARALLVASPGGHLDELVELAPRLSSALTDWVWVTPDTPQTRSLLADEAVQWVPPVGSRQLRKAMASLPVASSTVRHSRPDLLVTTGAALAIPYLVAARRHDVPSFFVDSATRLAGPSVSGRLAARVPGVRLRHQGFTRPGRRWELLGSVFDGFRAEPTRPAQLVPAPRRVVVTLGTERFPFPRALVEVSAALPTGAEVIWQIGHTPPPEGLPGTVTPWLPFRELQEAIANADLVVMHGGVGSVLTALRLGKRPVVLPRRHDHHEHVDDHQRQLAAMLAERDLAQVADAPGDVQAALAAAPTRAVHRDSSAVAELLPPPW